MRELPHNRMAYFPSALLRFIGRYDYSWTTFWTTASCIFIYNFMWQRGSSQGNVQVFEEAFPENCSGRATQGPLMDLKNLLMKSTTVSINRNLSGTWTIFTTGFSNRRTRNLQASVAFC